MSARVQLQASMVQAGNLIIYKMRQKMTIFEHHANMFF